MVMGHALKFGALVQAHPLSLPGPLESMNHRMRLHIGEISYSSVGSVDAAGGIRAGNRRALTSS
jgi:hypothetical protein